MNTHDPAIEKDVHQHITQPIVLMAHRILQERLRVFAEDIFELDGVQASVRDIVIAANKNIEGTSIPLLSYPGVQSRFDRDAITMRIKSVK
ncbi:MAG: hypothetical protein ACK5YL_02135 [Holosporales bacterium]